MTRIEPKAGPYQLFMLGLCVYVLLALTADTFFRLDDATSSLVGWIDTGICLIFLADFFGNLARAPKKLAFLISGQRSTFNLQTFNFEPPPPNPLIARRPRGERAPAKFY